MSIIDKINALDRKISSLFAFIQGTYPPGNLYALIGNQIVFGCLVTEGFSSTDFILALEEDISNINPDKKTPVTKPYHYANVANIYGRAFFSQNINESNLENENLVISDSPGTVGTGRYDIVYLFVGSAGSGIKILTSTASAACKTDFDTNGIEQGSYPQEYDPTSLPEECVPIARVYVQYGDTGISNSRIVDLRTFHSRVCFNCSFYGGGSV